MMSEEFLNRLALGMCMQTGHRYLECLNYVAIQNQMFIAPSVFKQVRKDFLDYREKMLAAGMPVHLDTLITTGVDHE